MGTRAGVAKATALRLKHCPQQCGRRCLARVDMCQFCRKGAPGLHEPMRHCIDCDAELPRAIISASTRCKRCIMRKQHRDGVFDNVVHPEHWTAEEETQLRALAGHVSTKVMRRTVLWHRTISAIQGRAQELGLSLMLEDWSLLAVERLFGISADVIRRDWLAAGLLPGRFVEGRWCIREADLETFIRDYPWMYLVSRMQPPQHPLSQLAQRVHRRDPWLSVKAMSTRYGIGNTAIRVWCRTGVLPSSSRSRRDHGARMRD